VSRDDSRPGTDSAKPAEGHAVWRWTARRPRRPRRGWLLAQLAGRSDPKSLGDRDLLRLLFDLALRRTFRLGGDVPTGCPECRCHDVLLAPYHRGEGFRYAASCPACYAEWEA
jgi:hypothetical protein